LRLSISNIAWDVAEDEAIARLLKTYHVNAIDIAPGKYFPDPHIATSAEIASVRQWWADRGIEIVGMQALLFGTTGFNVFGTADVQDKMLAHLKAICRIGGEIGARRIVFGSPKQRDRGDLSDAQVAKIAAKFFRQLGDIAAGCDVTICLEPNPTHYGANFMTTSAETAEVVRAINHPNIRMQFDTGAVTINQEDPLVVLRDNSALIGHVHLSEPDLLPLGDAGTDHQKCANALMMTHSDSVLTIEMVATKNEPHLASIKRALIIANKYYGTKVEGQKL
tara:strand:- start:435 stop:1271 length:837 start_codon:yes stop_codon:yes gene_type:complete